MQTSENNANMVQGTGQTIFTPAQHNICPGCGKCNVCGRQNEIPFTQPFTQPFISWGSLVPYQTWPTSGTLPYTGGLGDATSSGIAGSVGTAAPNSQWPCAINSIEGTS